MIITEYETAPVVRVKGEARSADASAGVAITLYEEGASAARTLLPTEYLVIESISLVSAAGGDCRVFIGADATPAASEYVLRGTYAVTGGESKTGIRAVGALGHTAWVIAPAGVIDVIFFGQIRKK